MNGLRERRAWGAVRRAAPRRGASTLLAAAMLVLAIGGEVWAQGCAMCAASMPGTDDPLSTGFGYSIYIFLGVTYGLIMVGGGAIGFIYWRASAASQRSTRVLAFQPLRKEEQS